MLFAKTELTDERKAFYERIDKDSLTPLWEVLGNLVPPHPAPACVPALWRYRQVRPYLTEAGHLISALTPSWTFHDHGNPGDAPVIWLDGLDIPMVAFFDAGFAERYPRELQPVTRPEGDALARFGANMLPLDYAVSSGTTPIFTYPYARCREALEQLRGHGAPHASHGLKMQYSNPATGGYPMPTIGAFIQLLPAGFQGLPYRATDGTVYCIVEGRGESRVGESVFEWEPHDIFVVPSWCRVSHHADEEAVLFSYSDRPVQKALGLWREEAPTENPR